MIETKLNILLITVRADFGGGPEHIYSLIKSLNKENDFYIACPDDFPYKMRYSKIIGENKIILIPHRKFKPAYLFKLIKFIKVNKIDLIHSHGKGAGIYGRLLSLFTSRPSIHTFHGWHIGSYNRFQKRIYIYIEKFLSLYTKRFIFVSYGELNEITGYKICKPSKISVIENAVAIPASDISEENFHSHPKALITFTRFNYQKNSSQLIDIFKELRRRDKAKLFKMVILGVGEEEDEIKKMVEKYNLEETFSFIGMVENPSVYLENSFCYISTSRWEGMPLAVLEAMSFGVPVIATNVTGNNNIVEHNKTGFLYDVNDPQEAAELIIQLSQDFKLWKSVIYESRKLIESRFSLNRMATETQEIYNSII